MKIAALLLFGLMASLSSCKGTSSKAEPSATRCICGTPEADFEGCAHPMCVKGERNPNNPACVCGPLKLGGKQ